MNEPERCTECGAMLDPDALRKLCPACLLKHGLETQTGGAEISQPAAADYVPPTPDELAPLFPDLEIIELVGRGGMGVVYKARQKRLDRLVALKILAPAVGKDPAFADRFAREARAMAMLSHPHVVAVYDFGHAGPALLPREGREQGGQAGLYYFLMEFVDGLNLRRLMASGKLRPQEALAIVPQICEALQYAHDHGVVHRDIKPENVLLDKNGQVKIADFGLAKLMGREAKDFTLTGVGQVMGTPNYMAPEQIEHPQDVDHRADIYSLGVVFYQMLTGELPLGRFAPPSRKVQIDVRLDDVVLRALEKEPERRYQQASQVKTEVETIANGKKPQLHSDRLPLVGVRNGRRAVNVRGIVARLTAIAIAAAVIALTLHLIWPDKPQMVLGGVGCAVAFMLLVLIVMLIVAAKTPLEQLVPFDRMGSGEERPKSPAVDETSSAAARRQVKGPAIGLFATGILNWLVAMLLGLFAALTANARPMTDTGFHILLMAFLLMALSILVLIAGLKMQRLQAYWLSVIASMLAIVISPSNLIGLPIGVWALVVLTQREVRAVFASNVAPSKRLPRKSWPRKLGVSVAIALVLALVARTFFVEAFIVPGDRAAPEVPRGSRVLAWKLANTFVAHDLIVYKSDDHTNLGRVVCSAGTDLIVNRNGQPDLTVPRNSVVGKVICVYWRASPPEEPDKGIGRLQETPPTGSGVAPRPPEDSGHAIPPARSAEAEIPESEQKAQAARIEVLRKAYEIVKAQSLTGGADIEDVSAALNALLEAQLAATTTKAERIAILEAMLANRRDAEKIWEARYRNGRTTEVDLDRAQADRLDAEIRLEREKAAAGTESPSLAANREAEGNTRKLQDERIVSRTKAFRAIDTQYRYGTADFGQRVAALDALLAAQLDAAETKAARMDILQKMLENRRDVERFAKGQFKNGIGSEADYLRAQANSMAAESRLAKERATADDSSSKPGGPLKPRGAILRYWAAGGLPEADKTLVAVDRTLNSGGQKLAQVRMLNPLLIEIALLRPDEADRQRVQRLLSRPGMLEFHVLANPQKNESVIELARKEPTRTIVGDARHMGLASWVPVKEGYKKTFTSAADVICRKQDRNPDITEVLVMPDPYNLTDAYIAKAQVETDNNGPCIDFTLNEAGGKLMAKLTGMHLPEESGKVRYRLGIILNGELVSAPNINDVISDRGKITGNFTKEEAAEIAETLNAGSLPVPLTPAP